MKLLLVSFLLSIGLGGLGDLGGLSCTSRNYHYSAITNTGNSNIILKTKLKDTTTIEIFKSLYIEDSDSLYPTSKFIQIEDTAKNFKQVIPIKDENIQFDIKTNTATLIIPPNKKMLLPAPWKYYFKSVHINLEPCEEELFLKGSTTLNSYFRNIPESHFSSADKIKDVKIGCQ